MQDLKYVTLRREKTLSEKADALIGILCFIGVLVVIVTGILDRIAG